MELLTKLIPFFCLLILSKVIVKGDDITEEEAQARINDKMKQLQESYEGMKEQYNKLKNKQHAAKAEDRIIALEEKMKTSKKGTKRSFVSHLERLEHLEDVAKDNPKFNAIGETVDERLQALEELNNIKVLPVHEEL